MKYICVIACVLLTSCATVQPLTESEKQILKQTAREVAIKAIAIGIMRTL